jgi:hypothetical protein
MLYTYPGPRVSIIKGKNTFPGIRAHILINNNLEGSIEFSERNKLSVGIHRVYSEYMTFPEDYNILFRGHYVHSVYAIHGLSISIKKSAMHILALRSTANNSWFHSAGLEIALKSQGRHQNDSYPLSLAM